MLKSIVNGVEHDIVSIPMKGKNLWDENYTNISGTIQYVPIYVGNGSFTLSTTMPYDIGVANLFLLSGNVSTGASTAENGAWLKHNATAQSGSGYITIAYRQYSGTTSPAECKTMLNAGPTALPYEPCGYQNGWEIRDNQNNIVWGREDTITEIPPFDLRTYGLPINTWELYGNSSQLETPTPDNPVMPEFVGTKAEQLYDENRSIVTSWELKTDTFIIGCYGNNKSTVPQNIESYNIVKNEITVKSRAGGCGIGVIVEIESDKTYTLSFDTSKEIDGSYFGFNLINSNGTLVEYLAPPNTKVYTFNSGSAKYAYFVFRINPLFGEITYSNIMLNAGDTALPYEPYGWAEKITCGGQTTPVYLGQVSTVRRVKKLVLTGEESYDYQSQYSRYVFSIQDAFADGTRKTQCICSHYKSVHNGEAIYSVPNNSIYINQQQTGTQFCIKDESITSADDFKSYLAQQYTNGTPVTIWYVLATPTNGIVNEPLCKIGDYVDELSSTNAAISIQTTDGINKLDVDTDLKPSYLSLTGHIKIIWYILKDVDGYILKDVDGYILNVKE